jgi:hypothetical protein
MLSLTWLYIGVLRNQNAFFNYCFNNIELGDQLPWFQRFIFIIFIAKLRGKINLWNQGRDQLVVCKYSLGSPVFTKFRFT